MGPGHETFKFDNFDDSTLIKFNFLEEGGSSSLSVTLGSSQSRAGQIIIMIKIWNTEIKIWDTEIKI